MPIIFHPDGRIECSNRDDAEFVHKTLLGIGVDRADDIVVKRSTLEGHKPTDDEVRDWLNANLTHNQKRVFNCILKKPQLNTSEIAFEILPKDDEPWSLSQETCRVAGWLTGIKRNLKHAPVPTSRILNFVTEYERGHLYFTDLNIKPLDLEHSKRSRYNPK